MMLNESKLFYVIAVKLTWQVYLLRNGHPKSCNPLTLDKIQLTKMLIILRLIHLLAKLQYNVLISKVIRRVN